MRIGFLNILQNKFFQQAGVIAFLIAAILVVYWQVGNHAFISLDDEGYITDNPMVRQGLSLSGLAWAFTTMHAGNWHPVTWISHMVDVQLFGLNPSGHHLENVALHAVNAVLLFLLLNKVTRRLWRSIVVAALFALHPLHVESVVWAAERKDVLSTLFMMISLHIYVGYVNKPNLMRYGLLSCAFALGLMSKPMLVTMPCILLLMDYWPLDRYASCQTGTNPDPFVKTFLSLVCEKIPLFLLAVASGIVTIHAQYKGNALSTLANTSLVLRVGNAFVSYVNYLKKMFWPWDLAIFYPFPESVPVWQPLCSAALLFAISYVVFRERRRHPYLIVGWAWFIITLLPVIGIIRVGLQSLADRYSYVPLTGVFVMLVWGVADTSKSWPARRSALALVTAAVLLASIAIARQQVSYWQSNTKLFIHALQSTRDNFVAHCALGRELTMQGRFEEALYHFSESERIAPWHDYGLMYQGICLYNLGRFNAAAVKFYDAIMQNPSSAPAYENLGITLAQLNKTEEAIENFRMALKLNPTSAVGHYNLGLALGKSGKAEEAITHYYWALKANPNYPECHNSLGEELVRVGRLDEAEAHFSNLLRISPDNKQAKLNLQRVVQLRQKESIK